MNNRRTSITQDELNKAVAYFVLNRTLTEYDFNLLKSAKATMDKGQPLEQRKMERAIDLFQLFKICTAR